MEQIPLSRNKKILFIGAGVVLFFIALEIGLHVVGFFARYGRPDDLRSELKAYRDLPYRNELFAEFRKIEHLKPGFVRFVEWEREPFQGKYLNIDENHIRRGWNPDAFDGEPVDVYMFGGSTTWGPWVRDEYTLPSHVSKILNASNPKYRVTNYGQEAYSFTQEVIKLITLLREGHRPDIVTFYDGVNDVGMAYIAGEPGNLLGEQIIRRKLEDPALSTFVKSDVKFFLSDQCRLCRIALNIGRSYSSHFLRPRIEGMHYEGADFERLADEIVGDYEKTLALVDALSKAYGFKYAAFWQPTVFTEEKLIGEENDLGVIDWTTEDPKYKALHRETVAHLDRIKNPNFHVAIDALANREVEAYLDNCHLSEYGNELIAKRIAETIRAILPKR